MKCAYTCAVLAVFLFGTCHPGADAGGAPRKTKRYPPLEKGPGEILAMKGDITDRDPKDSVFDNYAHPVPVKLEEGKTYQIDMTGIVFGCLRLEDLRRESLASDTGGAGLNRPRIIHQAKKSGLYLIICTSMNRRPETGTFTLRVKEVSSDPKELAKPLELKLVNGRAAADSELEVRGPRYKDGIPCKFLSVPLEAGRMYQIEMLTREFTPHVFVEDPLGKVLGEDHRKAGGTASSASVKFSAETAGVYRVIAGQFGARIGGGPQFRIEVKDITPKK